MRIAVSLLAVVMGTTAVAAPLRRDAPQGCVAEAGARAGGQLLRDCRAVLPREPASCRPETSCEALRVAVRRGCEAAGADALPLCESHSPFDDEDEDDE